MYNKQIIDRFVAPHNIGLIKGADAVGSAKNEDLGEVAKVYLTVENEIITDAKFKAFGCITSMVGLDLLMDEIKGKNIEEITNVSFDEIVSQMGEVSREKLVCLGLMSDVLVDALKDYHKKQLRLQKLRERLALEQQTSQEESPIHIALIGDDD